MDDKEKRRMIFNAKLYCVSGYWQQIPPPPISDEEIQVAIKKLYKREISLPEISRIRKEAGN